MLTDVPFELLALAALGVTSLHAWDPDGLHPPLFWWQMLIVVVTSAAWTALLIDTGWQVDFGTTLWVTVGASAAVFTLVSLLWPFAQRLAPLLMPFLTVLGVLGSSVRGDPHAMADGTPPLWLDLHIVIAVGVSGILTVAAVASLGVALQERSLKNKTLGRLSNLLPSVNDAEQLAGKLLALVEVLLGVGLFSGMALQFAQTGQLLRLDHKTLLSISAFVLIGLLFIGHRVCGVRGRIAARVVLTAYLLILLAYPGVKFVTQFLL